MGSTGVSAGMAGGVSQGTDIGNSQKSIKGQVNSMSAAELNAYIEEHNLLREYYDRLGSLPWGATSRDRAKVRKAVVVDDMTVNSRR